MRARILWVSLLITFIGIIIFSFASTQVYYNSSVEYAKEGLKIYMNAFDAEDFPIDPSDAQTTSSSARAFSERLNGARVTIMDSDGQVIGESQADGIEADHSDREEVRQALSSASGEGYAVRSSQTVGKNMIYYCRLINIEGTEQSFLVRIATPTDSEWAMFAQALPTVAVYLILDILGCLLFTFIASYFMLSPIEKLTREATLGGEVRTKYPEFTTIANVLNERNRNIEWQMQEIKEEKQLVEKAQNSKNEFIANVTHEMNTPLTSIKGYAELLSSGMLNEEQKQLAYKTILSQSERLTNLIACIINYNEIDSDDLPSYEVDLTKLVREMISVVKPEADKRGITIIEEIDDNVTVQSRHELMTQLTGNLLRNAIRYNKDNGRITVKLDFRQFSVEDTGIGIAPENMEKVFSRFFTVDKSHGGKNGGFGLGLAVCKKICNRAGWRISVESEQGKGSKFTVDFALR